MHFQKSATQGGHAIRAVQHAHASVCMTSTTLNGPDNGPVGRMLQLLSLGTPSSCLFCPAHLPKQLQASPMSARRPASCPRLTRLETLSDWRPHTPSPASHPARNKEDVSGPGLIQRLVCSHSGSEACQADVHALLAAFTLSAVRWPHGHVWLHMPLQHNSPTFSAFKIECMQLTSMSVFRMI